MSDYGKRLEESFKQALEIAQGTAKPGTYRITQYDDDGNPTVIADFSDEFLAQIDAEIAAEREQEEKAKSPSIEQPTG
ncbi:MAG: hypothetical protein F4X02_08305 [Chloroflexi bacterium]|nr:hypothetical protein [Chloroflexota bacterium]